MKPAGRDFIGLSLRTAEVTAPGNVNPSSPTNTTRVNHLIFIVIVLHTAGLLSVAKVLLQQRSGHSKALWSFALLLCPYLALPYYWALGSSRNGGFRKDRQEVLKDMEALSAEIMELAKSHSVNTETTHCCMQALTKLPITSGNSVELLLNGENFFPSLYEAMSEAKDYILAQFYVVNDDDTGRQFAEQLKLAAARGVRVSFFMTRLSPRSLRVSFNVWSKLG